MQTRWRAANPAASLPAFRDRDAAGHLDALKSVSEEMSSWASANRDSTDARLRHYLANASFAKALAHLEAMAGD